MRYQGGESHHTGLNINCVLIESGFRNYLKEAQRPKNIRVRSQGESEHPYVDGF